MSVIKVKNLTKKYGDFTAVDNISFEVKKGEIVGFVGKNGAGKSTTIRTMMNFIAPTQGACELCNQDSVTSSKSIRHSVGYMPSDAMFYEGVTGKEVFKLCTKIGKVPFEKIEELCKFLELDMSKKVSELSLGNRKKVSIIQAVLKDTELLILDEPTSGLDPLMQERFFELLLERQKQGGTIFLSSHNLTEIEKYCDRVLIIKDGRIIDEIDMKNSEIRKGQVVSYETTSGEVVEYEFSGNPNELIQQLASVDLAHIEIRKKSVEDEFIKYYQEDK